MLVTLRSCNYCNLPLPALSKNKVGQLHLGGFYMSAKALDRSSQTTKTECCQPDRYSTGLQRFPVQQKATKRWLEPGTRLITYAQAVYNGPFNFCMHFG